MRQLYLSVAFSNLWQFVISLLYLAYNAVLTAMLVANEWDRFGKTRKPLRVTEPQGHQRSTYSISVPLRYGLPILVAIGALHYTVSQSVFVVSLTRFFSDGREDIANRSATSGYSCIAIMTCKYPSVLATCAQCLLTHSLLSHYPWLCTSPDSDYDRLSRTIPTRNSFSIYM